MKTQRLAIRFGLAFFLTVVAGLAANEVEFGLIGLTPLETARLTAYCDGSVTPIPCEVTFTFHHAGGRTLKQSTMTIQPGATGFLDLTAAQTGISGLVQADPCWKISRGAALASLEVFDVVSQRTRILSNWGDRSVPRTGDIDFAVAGITAFDTLRLGAYCEGDGSVTPSPCSMVYEFHDANGRLVKQGRMTLQPETGGFADLRFAEAGGTGRRAEIDPCWKVERGNIVASLAVVDNFTGLTLTQAYPAGLARANQ